MIVHHKSPSSHDTVIPRLIYPAPLEPGSQAAVGLTSTAMGDLAGISGAVSSFCLSDASRSHRYRRSTRWHCQRCNLTISKHSSRRCRLPSRHVLQQSTHECSDPAVQLWSLTSCYRVNEQSLSSCAPGVRRRLPRSPGRYGGAPGPVRDADARRGRAGAPAGAVPALRAGHDAVPAGEGIFAWSRQHASSTRMLCLALRTLHVGSGM